MSYQLTTNLIADCMALIPHNLEKLNKNQKIFNIDSDKWVRPYFYSKAFGQPFERLDDYLKTIVISHCLRHPLR